MGYTTFHLSFPIQNQLTQNQSKLDQTNTSLTNWINLYNLSNPVITLDDIHAIYNSNCDWDGIRKNKETLQNDKTSAATLLANAQKEHEEHQKSRPQKSQEELILFCAKDRKMLGVGEFFLSEPFWMQSAIAIISKTK